MGLKRTDGFRQDAVRVALSSGLRKKPDQFTRLLFSTQQVGCSSSPLRSGTKQVSHPCW